MRETRAISGVDLHLDLAGTRVRAALESALREAASSGRLPPGSRLPSSRALAADLGLARNTVADAYGQLVAEGWLTARQGSGTHVSERAAATRDAVAEPAATGPRVRYDLLPGSPDLSTFPRSAWLAATRRALAVASYDALGYSDPRGLPELRTALAEYLARARGVRCTAERIVICSGFTQAFALLCQVLSASGATTLAIEQHVQPGVNTVAAAHLNLTTLPVDQEGAAVDQLGSEAAVLLTPAHQFPVGVPLSARRRAQVVEWALEASALVIEDDYDGEFRYDRHPLGALQALAPERIVYAGTASKTLAPGLRLGWLVVPSALSDSVVSAKTLADRNSSAIDQLTLAEFIRSGAYDRHVRRSRLSYRRRRDRLVAAVERRAPHVRVSGIAAGLHALVELPATWSEEDVVGRASARGLAVEGLSTYAHGPHQHRAALVVGYAKPAEHAFTGALARLLAVLAQGEG